MSDYSEYKEPDSIDDQTISTKKTERSIRSNSSASYSRKHRKTSRSGSSSDNDRVSRKSPHENTPKSEMSKYSEYTQPDSNDDHIVSTRKTERSSHSSPSTLHKKQRKPSKPANSFNSDDTGNDGALGKALSMNEMRTKLFSSFKSKGLLSNLKSQLRTNLASAIKEGEYMSSAIKSDQNHDTIAASISEFLIAEHLKKANYEYSLSVFRTESPSSNVQFAIKDIVNFLKIDPNSGAYQNLVSLDRRMSSKSLLFDMLSATLSSDKSLKVSIETQTNESNEICSGRIEQKMLEIEEDVFNKGMREIESESSTLEARMFELQRKMELQKKSELAAELNAFRAKELAEVRIYEREEMRKEVERVRQEMEKNYRKLQEKLNERERESEELMRIRKGALDQEAFKNRQQMLADIDALRERENEMKRSHELAMQSLSMEQSKAKAFAAELKAKELSLKSVEERYENKLKEEILRIKLQKQEEEQKHQQHIRAEQTKLEVEKNSFESQKLLLTKYNDDFERTKSENSQLQISLNTAMKKISELTQKSDYLNDRLREFSDYHSIKEKSLVLAKELEISKLKLKEVNDEKESLKQKQKKKINDLMEKLTKHPIDKNVMDKQYESERLELMEKEKQLTEKCNLFEKKLHSEILKNKELNNLYDEKLLQQKAMVREIEELKTSLRKVQNSCHIPTSAVSTGRTSTLWRSSETQPLTSTWQSRIPAHSKLSETTYGRSPKSIEKSSVVPDDITSKNQLGITFVRESKDVFEKLEKEAAELEKSYRNYQQKLRLQEQFTNGKPNTNDYTVLEKYHSTFFPKSADFMPINRVDSSAIDLTAARMPCIEERDSSEQNSKDSMIVKAATDLQQGKSSHKRDVLKDNSVNNIPVKAFADTWTGDYLTEQLLASAVNEQDDEPPGNTLPGIENKHDLENERGSRIEYDSIQSALHVPVKPNTKSSFDAGESSSESQNDKNLGHGASMYMSLSEKAKTEHDPERSNLSHYAFDKVHETSSSQIQEELYKRRSDIKPDFENKINVGNIVDGSRAYGKIPQKNTGHLTGRQEEGVVFGMKKRELHEEASLKLVGERYDDGVVGRPEESKVFVRENDNERGYGLTSVEGSETEVGENERQENAVQPTKVTQYVENYGTLEEYEHEERDSSILKVSENRDLEEPNEDKQREHENVGFGNRDTWSLRKDESFDGSQSFAKRSEEIDQLEAMKKKEEEERRLAFEREKRELERLEREEHEQAEHSLSSKSNSESLKSENIEKSRKQSGEQSLESSLKTTEEVLPQAEEINKDDEIKIDPLMQHYMQMIMNKKQQESAEGAKVGDTAEDLNLTDDFKLESKISNKSDVTELLEEQIENIENLSDDDFDW